MLHGQSDASSSRGMSATTRLRGFEALRAVDKHDRPQIVPLGRVERLADERRYQAIQRNLAGACSGDSPRLQRRREPCVLKVEVSKDMVQRFVVDGALIAQCDDAGTLHG